jgi:hypothetical protein
MASETWSRVKTAYIYWFARRLPACDEILTIISQRMDRKLPWRQRMKLLLHNHICVWCRNYAKQLLVVREAMRRQESQIENTPFADATLSPQARERMKRSLGQQ